MDEKPPRKKSQKRQRNWQIKVPCLEHEFNHVAAEADAAGMSRAAYARAKLLGDAGPRARRRPPANEQILLKVFGLHGRYGNNLNQIAHNLNAGDPCDLPELRSALKEWAQIRDLMFEALGRDPSPFGQEEVAPGGSRFIGGEEH